MKNLKIYLFITISLFSFSVSSQVKIGLTGGYSHIISGEYRTNNGGGTIGLNLEIPIGKNYFILLQPNHFTYNFKSIFHRYVGKPLPADATPGTIRESYVIIPIIIGKKIKNDFKIGAGLVGLNNYELTNLTDKDYLWFKRELNYGFMTYFSKEIHNKGVFLEPSLQIGANSNFGFYGNFSFTIGLDLSKRK